MRGINCTALWIKALYKCSPFTIYHFGRIVDGNPEAKKSSTPKGNGAPAMAQRCDRFVFGEMLVHPPRCKHKGGSSKMSLLSLPSLSPQPCLKPTICRLCSLPYWEETRGKFLEVPAPTKPRNGLVQGFELGGPLMAD